MDSIRGEPCNLKLDVQSLGGSKIIQFEKDEPFVDDDEECFVDDDDTENPHTQWSQNAFTDLRNQMSTEQFTSLNFNPSVDNIYLPHQIPDETDGTIPLTTVIDEEVSDGS